MRILFPRVNLHCAVALHCPSCQPALCCGLAKSLLKAWVAFLICGFCFDRLKHTTYLISCWCSASARVAGTTHPDGNTTTTTHRSACAPPLACSLDSRFKALRTALDGILTSLIASREGGGAANHHSRESAARLADAHGDAASNHLDYHPRGSSRQSDHAARGANTSSNTSSPLLPLIRELLACDPLES